MENQPIMTHEPQRFQPKTAPVFCRALLRALFLFCVYAGRTWAAEYEGTSLKQLVHTMAAEHPGKSGASIFERGEEALLARAWLCDHAEKSIDVQYFIWSSDNIGILAAEALLRAAERGVRVRVIVDDLMIDAPDRSMLALNSHPNISIRIYNPKHTVGVSLPKRLYNLIFDFRAANQRMHDKTLSVDGVVAITGGRNMADEYFDYNTRDNFRDRDLVLFGPVVRDVKENFESFWNSALVVPVEALLEASADTYSARQTRQMYAELHAYGADPEHFKPTVRQSLRTLDLSLPLFLQSVVWADIAFTHDKPGKNDDSGLKGGGATTSALIEALTGAQKSVIIQTPYLVMPPGGIALFRSLIKKGVLVKISTNSLAATDNIQAFSGYLKQRDALLKAGIKIHEYKPAPSVQRELIARYEMLKQSAPTFAIHAKSMVIDRKILFVGTFNLDPRSANLNTEVGALINNEELAGRVEAAIRADMQPENSWNSSRDNPDHYASLGKRLKVFFWKLWPLEPLL